MADFATESERLGKVARSHSSPTQTAATDAPQHPLLRLQGAAGNRAVARMVQRHGDELQMKHDLSLQRMEEEEETIQGKHDPSLQRMEEEEETIQGKHDPSLQRMEEEEIVQGKHDPSLQRIGDEEELQMKHDPTPKVGLEGGPVGADISSQIDSMRGGGSSLGSGFLEKMEGGFGTSFQDVRVHQDAQSDVLNRQMTAKAFTTGSDIFLRSDASTSDEHLMAHELTHVVQQRSGIGNGGPMTAGPADDPLEHEADHTADMVLSGAAQRKLENEQS